MPIAIANGVARNLLYMPYVGDLFAHQISTIIGITLFVFVGYLFFRGIVKEYSYRELILSGLFLVIMTILFEFGFCHFVDNISWKKCLADYNIFKGRVWTLFLFAEFMTPALIKKLVVIKKLVERRYNSLRGDIYGSKQS